MNAMSTDRMTAVRRAAHSAKWATTMAKWEVSHAASGHRSGTKAVVRWQLVDFPGPAGGESRFWLKPRWNSPRSAWQRVEPEAIFGSKRTGLRATPPCEL
jgi:hypothetical protein